MLPRPLLVFWEDLTCITGVVREFALDNIASSRTERKSCFPKYLTSSSSSREKYIWWNMAYGANKEKDSSIKRISWRSWLTVFIFRHITSCHERTTMTSEISENTISFGSTSPYVIWCEPYLGRSNWRLWHNARDVSRVEKGHLRDTYFAKLVNFLLDSEPEIIFLPRSDLSSFAKSIFHFHQPERPWKPT